MVQGWFLWHFERRAVWELNELDAHHSYRSPTTESLVIIDLTLRWRCCGFSVWQADGPLGNGADHSVYSVSPSNPKWSIITHTHTNALYTVTHTHSQPALPRVVIGTIKCTWCIKHTHERTHLYLIGASMILLSRLWCSSLATLRPVHSTATEVTRHRTMPRQHSTLNTDRYNEWLKPHSYRGEHRGNRLD
jgi:hypothetical protein